MAKKTTKGLDSLIGNIQQEAKQVNTGTEEKEENLSALFVEIPASLKKKLDVYCILHDTKRRDVIIDLIKTLPD